MHVVARCNNREFYFTTPEDFEILLEHLCFGPGHLSEDKALILLMSNFYS